MKDDIRKQINDIIEGEIQNGINDYIEKGIFPNFDVDLFALVIRPITDSLAQEMMSQKKIDINKYTEKCINFLTRGLGV